MATTRERTIADLIEANQDFSLVGDALADLLRQSRPNTKRLIELLSPLAKRKGFPKGDGEAPLDGLMRVAGADLEALSRKIASAPDLCRSGHPKALGPGFRVSWEGVHRHACEVCEWNGAVFLGKDPIAWNEAARGAVEHALKQAVRNTSKLNVLDRRSFPVKVALALTSRAWGRHS